MVRNKSLPSVSISDIEVGYKDSLWRYMTKLSYMNKLYEIPNPAFGKESLWIEGNLLTLKGEIIWTNKSFQLL